MRSTSGSIAACASSPAQFAPPLRSRHKSFNSLRERHRPLRIRRSNRSAFVAILQPCARVLRRRRVLCLARTLPRRCLDSTDATIATFVWLGSSDIIASVTDVKTTNPYTPLGNTFNRVEYVTSGGVSMATYVATNVQAVTDGYVHAVQAN